MKRGEVWLVSFTPSVGDEIRKTRPAVIISDDGLGVLDLRIVAPITAWQPAFFELPWMVRLEPRDNGLSKTSSADAFQMKSISTRRLIKRLGMLTEAELSAVVDAVGLVIGRP